MVRNSHRRGSVVIFLTVLATSIRPRISQERGELNPNAGNIGDRFFEENKLWSAFVGEVMGREAQALRCYELLGCVLQSG